MNKTKNLIMIEVKKIIMKRNTQQTHVLMINMINNKQTSINFKQKKLIMNNFYIIIKKKKFKKLSYKSTLFTKIS